jgi:hypothetical protein
MNESMSREGGISQPGETVEITPQFGAWEELARNPDGPRLLTANTLTGTRVLNRKDEMLGTISDIMLNVEEGGIAYAVMAAGGFMGIGERLYALPWYALALDTERRCCVLNAEKSAFDDAPSFDRSHLPEAPP